MNWTKDQIDSINKAKQILNIDKNEQLDSFVKCWSYHELQTHKDITPFNVDDFTQWIDDEFGI